MPDASDFFSRAELECRCGCGRADMADHFLAALDDVRRSFGPIRLSSAFRCPAHNARVSATGLDGPHTTGQAADILVSGKDAHRLLALAAIHGVFNGIGVAQTGPHHRRFIHLDTPELEGGLRPWLWSYG